MAIFQASAIYTRGQYVFNDPNNIIDINSTRVSAYSARNAWILRTLVPGTNRVQYNITFSPSSADLLDGNTLQGIYVEQDGQGVVIDCISIADFNNVANGTTTTITPRYVTAPAWTAPTANFWCITRTDDGSAFAHGVVATDYVQQYTGNIRLKSNISGVSVYTFKAYGTVVPVKSDSVVIC